MPIFQQQALSPRTITRIKQEIYSPSLARCCLRKVRMARSFIQSRGCPAGGRAGDTRLSEYLSSVMAETADCIPSSVARSEVCLRHLNDFETLLDQVVAERAFLPGVQQQPLLPHTTVRIKQEIHSPSLACGCLQKVRMARSSIHNLGCPGGHNGEMLLSEYLSSVMTETNDCIPSSVARSEVCLRHLNDFEKLLEQVISCR